MIREALLTKNKWSRPGKKLIDVRAIVLHWAENAGSCAEANRMYFENRKRGNTGFGSAHYIIDRNEIVRCIPEDEIAYHCATNQATLWAKKTFDDFPNGHTLGIELCHPDSTGKFEDTTLFQLKLLLAYLTWQYGIELKKRIILHHDVTGKNCPKWYVDNPEKLTVLKWELSEIRGIA